MKIDIHISDASPEQLAAIALALSPLQKPTVVVQKSNERRGWSKKAIKLANVRTAEAPYGLRLDGTPRKPTGLQKKKGK